MEVDTGLFISKFSSDYASGWKAGYRSVLTGGDGRVPVLPPRKYWDSPMFRRHDPGAKQDWCNGFQGGAKAAASQPSLHYVQPLFSPPVSYQCVPTICEGSVCAPVQARTSQVDSPHTETPSSTLPNYIRQPPCTIRLLGIEPILSSGAQLAPIPVHDEEHWPEPDQPVRELLPSLQERSATGETR